MGNNILEAYYPFFASILNEKKVEFIDEYSLQKEFGAKYLFEPSSQFVRQVLNIGIENKSIQKRANKYTVDYAGIKKYVFDSKEYDNQWKELISSFVKFCKDNSIEYDGQNIEEEIYGYIEDNDYKVLSAEDLDSSMTTSFGRAWARFISLIAETDKNLFTFVTSLCASNIYKEVLFYNVEEDDSFKDLSVYLDSPMVFALLGMDSKERTESYKLLVSDMIKAGINVQVLDNNFQEIEGIINRSASWANSTSYTIAKANNVAKFLHDLELSAEDMAEYCESVEDQLNEMGITIKSTEYNLEDALFQEDENMLFDMVKDKYDEQHVGISAEKETSIRTDVRSIVMVYRERKGRTAVKVQKCGHIMLTINGVLANVSKKYESNKSLQAGHIPACVSADLFGALLWMFKPNNILQYQKNKLLADCYAALKPSKQLLDKYIQSLETAKTLGEIDEKKFLFMRSHSMVNDALMNVTKGDYARYNDKTYLDVYEEIKMMAEKEYREEVKRHADTARELSAAENQVHLLREEFNLYKLEQQKKEEIRHKKICDIISTAVTVFMLLIPYIAILVLLEFVKAKYATTISTANIIYVGIAVVIGLFVAFLYTKLIEVIRQYVEKIYYKRINRVNGK